MKIIDAHCHIGQGCGYSLSADELLAQMDANGVSSAVIVPVDRCIAVDNVEGNNEMLAAARANPERMMPFATVNPWYGERAISELKRAFGEGAVGLKLHPVLQGFSIVDEIVYPVVEAAIEHRKPIYFHTGTPVNSTPFQLSELAMKFPEGLFIMGHVAYADYWNDVAAAVKCVPNIVIETSLHLASFIKVLCDDLGADKLIYGSDAPKTSMKIEIEKITRYVKSDSDLDMIFNANISRLLGGEG